MEDPVGRVNASGTKPKSKSPLRAESELRDIDHVDNLVRTPNHLASISDIDESAGAGSTISESDTGVSEREDEELRESFDRVKIQPEVAVDEIGQLGSGAEMTVTEEVGDVRETIQTSEMIEETVVIDIAEDEDETIGRIVISDTIINETETELDLDTDAAALDISGTEEIAEEPAFYLDVNPSMETDEPAQTFLFDRVTSAPIGEPASSSEEEEEEIVLVPRKHVQPEPIQLPEEPEYVRAKDGDVKPKESLIDKFGGKKPAGKDGRPVATTSLPGKNARSRTDANDDDHADEKITTASKGQKKNKKQAKREKRKNKKEERMKKTEGIVRHKVPRMDSDVEWGSDGPPRGASNELVTDEEDDAILRAGATRGMIGGLSTKGLSGAKKREMELLMDYLENTVGTEEPDSDDDVEEDEDAVPGIGGGLTASSMAAFVKGMSGTNQVTIDEINDARMLEEEDEDEDGWESSSGSELTDEDEDAQPVASGSTNKKSKSKLVEVAPGLLRQVDDGMDDSLGEDESDDTSDDEDDTAEMAGMGFGWAVPASSDSDSDTDSDEDKGDGDEIDQIFSGKKTWADATDDFIAAMDELVDDNDLVMGSGKKFEKHKLFNAIQNGDFGDGWATSESESSNVM